MRIAATVLAAGLIALAGCGGDDDEDTTAAQTTPDTGTAAADTAPKTTTAEKPAADGTRIIVAGSEFGTMLYGPDKQAIYVFERDSKDRSNCYDECAEAWPPVYTKGTPQAAKGVKQSLLGTTKRRDGRLQVTYAGQPLYYYANEAPGEVRCHNVNLNGGLWWVMAPSGQHRS